MILKKLIIILLCINYLFAIDIGSLNIKNDNDSKIIANDMKQLFQKYKINIDIKESNNSLQSINNLINNKTNNYFAIVNKDAIYQYNKNKSTLYDRSIYSKIPVILTIAEEQIHIFTNHSNEFEFDIKKDFTVYCGEKNGDSCISARYIANVYGFNFKYIDSNINKIQDDLKTNKVELYINVKKAPAIEFKDFRDIKLIDLPTNFKMEDMYVNTLLQKNMYTFLDSDIHTYSVKQALITTLTQKKYESLINSILKILVLNQDYLTTRHRKYWEETTFEYFEYKKLYTTSKQSINNLLEQVKRKNAMKF